ncbi:hypothetical protein [Paeniglutamicibacter sp. Y32M11]|uniref:hypothetical protein n=1 Tax=Paeniglutamicibacter sp. Y32M11 TaxID=2853258 RepID=UPI001C52B6A5|nr:hypothetical protein [Paeniglutamicibacter sp. Y32M11]QXQ11016.1 hypothetical protein KUF55_03525 [Paeniglutamicibacter sp. Y32M11]
MSTLNAPILRRPFSVRVRWGCGLLVFAASCYAIFGWLLSGSFHDAAGNQLLFYAGFHEGHISVLSFVLGGLATGALVLLLLGPYIWRLNLRHWVLDLTLMLLASLIGLALLLGTGSGLPRGFSVGLRESTRTDHRGRRAARAD